MAENPPPRPPARRTRPELVRDDGHDDAAGATDSRPAPAGDGDLAALRLRLENIEARLQDQERIARWTQMMLKHHERLLRRQIHKAMSNAG